MVKNKKEFKGIAFRMQMKGTGVVNYDAEEQKFFLGKNCGMNLAFKNSNYKFAKKAFFKLPEEESSKPFNTPTILGCVESGDKKLFEAANDFETMYNESERVYNKDYSTGEYCHEQSFKWGFQEGFDFAMKLIKGE